MIRRIRPEALCALFLLLIVLLSLATAELILAAEPSVISTATLATDAAGVGHIPVGHNTYEVWVPLNLGEHP
jgi:hypothetical protein